MKRYLLVILFILQGCSSIQEYERLIQPTDTALQTYVGGTVFKIERSSDLPNAVGKADMWGGKIDRGFLELRYQGVSDDGRLVFHVTDVQTKSNETSMSRYGSDQSTFNARSYGNSTYGNITTYRRPDGQTIYLAPNSTAFAIDSDEQEEFRIGNVMVRIIEATPVGLTYIITESKAQIPKSAQ